MNQPANLDLFALLNYVVERQPSALGILVLNPRVASVKFRKRALKQAACHHRPSGETNLVGVLGCPCRKDHARDERCSVCGKMIPWHDFPGRQLRDALVTVELPGAVGENLKGPEPDQALLVAFSVDRATYDEYLRRARLAESGIVLPPGAVI